MTSETFSASTVATLPHCTANTYTPADAPRTNSACLPILLAPFRLQSIIIISDILASEASLTPSKNIRTIQPSAGPVRAVVPVPGSKSITNRLMLLAALARGTSRISGILRSDDTDVFAQALQSLGFQLRFNNDRRECLIQGSGGTIPAQSARVWCGSAGTAARFLAAAVAAGNGRYILDATPQMRRRPMTPLLDALASQGATIRVPPDVNALLTINTDGLKGGLLTLGGAHVSSQYLSALLMAAPMAKTPLEIQTAVPVSRPYVDMTIGLMSQFGVNVDQQAYERFRIPAPTQYQGGDHVIEPDASTASYFFAAAAVTAGTVTVPNLSHTNSVQGDVRFLDVLEKMGCAVASDNQSTTVTGPAKLRGVSVDMSQISDTVMTLAAIAPYAQTPTTISNIGHIRVKESDRISALADGLARMGVTFNETHDSLTIHPSTPRGAIIDSHEDHRIAMSFSIAGLVTPGVAIQGPDCVVKTCPQFFDLLNRLN